MKIRHQILLVMFTLFLIGTSSIVYWIFSNLEPQYRMATEEPLVDTATILASLASASAIDQQIDVELFRKAVLDAQQRDITATIYSFAKHKFDFRVYLTDSKGIVLFDSVNGEAEGEDYSQWRDINRTLSGGYGARTTRDFHGDPNTSVMFVAAPVIVNQQIIGVVSVGKPTATANDFVNDTKSRMFQAVLWISLLLIILAYYLSGQITKPIKKLTKYAEAVRDEKSVTLPKLKQSEVKLLGQALDEMRTSLDGKQYIEDYVQTFSHEMKSPVAAISGAAELLQEEVPDEQRAKFLNNISNESERINLLLKKMSLLTSVEKQGFITKPSNFTVSELINSIEERVLPLLLTKKLSLKISQIPKLTIKADRFLLEQALVNLLQNAIDFSETESEIDLKIETTELHLTFIIRDYGSGIPEYAFTSIFKRFYSLQRPDSGKKSTGIGLALVKEIAKLHGGSVQLKNCEQKGVKASFTIKV